MAWSRDYRFYQVEPPKDGRKEWVGISQLNALPFKLVAASESDLRYAIDRAHDQVRAAHNWPPVFEGDTNE